MLNPDGGVDRSRLARGAVLAGAAVTLIGVVLPWVEVRIFFGRVTVAGLDTNPGKFCSAAAIFAGLLVLVASRTDDPDAQKAFRGLCLLPAATVVFLAGFNLQDIDGLDTGTSGATAEIGIGLWVTLLGGIVLLAGAIVAVTVRTVQQAPDDGPPPPFWFPGSVPPGGAR